MRRGPLIGNVFSITSSYGFVVGLSRFLSSRLPYNDKYPWHKDQPCPSPSQHECLLPDLSQNIITAESELLNNTRAQYILGWMDKGNNWVDKMDVLILYIVGILCLLALPLYDLWVGRGHSRINRGDEGRDAVEAEEEEEEDLNEEITEEEISTVPRKEDITDPPKDDSKHTEDSREQSTEDLELIEESEKEQKQDSNLSETPEDNIEEVPEEATLEHTTFQQDDSEITPNPDISLEEEVLSNEQEHLQEPDQEHLQESDQEPLQEQRNTYVPQISEESSPDNGVSSPVPIPKGSRTLNDSISLQSKPDLLNPNSQSSSSSFLQFSPSKSSHFDAQVDTKNAYSQPFKFK